MSVEFVELSAVFSVLYEEFNIRFFEGSLPPYRVKVMHNIPVPRSRDTSPESAQVSMERQEIAILYNGWPNHMLGRLVGFMAYIRIGGEPAALEHELDRLRGAGAPTSDEVDRLAKAGWTMYCGSPWSVS